MQSLYDPVFAALEDCDYSISNVSIRKPYDESGKTYPLIVVHEIVNRPKEYGTVTGELETSLAYQLDIETQVCVDDTGTPLTRYEAGRRLVAEVTDLLESTFKITRRYIHNQAVAADTLRHVWRGDSVLDSSGYTYRP